MRIDASSLISIKPEVAELLKSLEAGDILKGRVIEALGNSIAIRTSGGQLFTAMLQEGSRVEKGAFVELIISSVSDGKVFAELKTEAAATDADTKLSQLLIKLGLPVEEKNMEALKLLVKYKLPLSKTAVTNITGLQKSVDNLNASSEGRIGLLLSGLDIKNTPVDELNRIVLNWSEDFMTAEAAMNTLQQPVSSISPDINADGKGLEQEAAKSNVTNVTKKETDSTVNKPITAETAAKEPVIESGKAAAVSVKDNSIKAYSSAEQGAELLKLLDKLGIEAGNAVKQLTGQVTEILTAIKDTDMEAITFLLSKEIEATPKNLGMLIRNIQNNDDISKFLDRLQQRIDTRDEPELKEIKESIRKVFLEPRQLKEAEEVSEQLKEVARLGEKLERYLSSSGGTDTEIRDTLAGLRDNIDFIKSINQHYNYLQVPVLINGDSSTAKLYVFKEGKRSKAINPENATILLALDLKSLGHLESLIGVTGKTVNITFRAANKAIGSFIEKQSHLLIKPLEQKGYKLNPVRVISIEQTFNLLTLEAMINEGVLDKIHFDKRV